ncbi:hypothetical protein Acy02nite_26900 [Actinoplanes cyaneus]|uniref:DUF4386 domain-containing protein n=1 Tax=Actinoplanes cyaneus TaxID=52696 RepID=A0A919IFD6_9ACTN|nr:DUF4386 domain-containing protein [Actinoplanes cyaneus]MCW2137983.1 protein of unknown function (DUF4386) [Actinoplanes cyaneus]GID64809.1 hypothetical protein Acy02nite_26900 [Actinoplanes cyaneus]
MRTERATGLAYLGLALCGLLGHLIIQNRLYVAGDATATTANLAAHPTLAGLGIAADLGVVVTQALAALLFFRLFRPIDDLQAAAVAAFGLINSVIVLVGTMVTAVALATVRAGGTAPVLLLYDLNAAAWTLGGVFFGLWLIPMGRLTVRSGVLPRWLGLLLIVGGAGYVAGAFVAYLAADTTTLTTVLALPASIGEFGMIGYLLLKRNWSAAPS